MLRLPCELLHGLDPLELGAVALDGETIAHEAGQEDLTAQEPLHAAQLAHERVPGVDGGHLAMLRASS